MVHHKMRYFRTYFIKDPSKQISKIPNLQIFITSHFDQLSDLKHDKLEYLNLGRMCKILVSQI